MKVRRSAAASEDIDRIWLHVAQLSPAAADQLVDRIVAATAPLSDFPDMGSLRPELGPGIRVVMVGAYLIFYRRRGTELVVERVLHGRRDIRPGVLD